MCSLHPDCSLPPLFRPRPSGRRRRICPEQDICAKTFVELGGIEPLEIVWLGVDLCCSVVVSCDDAG